MGDGEGERRSLSIVKYHPNRYRGMLDFYLTGGWSEDGDKIRCRGVSIDKRIFEEEEAYYVIAHVHNDLGNCYTKMESVEDRLLYLEDEDHPDFLSAYREANRILLSDEFNERSLKGVDSGKVCLPAMHGSGI